MIYHITIELVKILIWPVVVIAGYLLLRKYIPYLIARINKVTVFGVEINLEGADITKTPFENIDLNKISKLIGTGSTSYIDDLLNTVFRFNKYEIDYVKIDLGSGNNWLASRLYILAILMNLKGLKYWVIVYSDKDEEKKYLGWVTSEIIIRKLSEKYPELVETFNDLHDQLNLKIDNSILDSDNLGNIVHSFISKLQTEDYKEYSVKLSRGSEGNKEEIYFERTEWLNKSLFEELFNNSLNQNYIVDDPYKSNEEQVKAILRQKGKYIGVIDKKEKFKRLIDRDVILEKVALKIID